MSLGESLAMELAHESVSTRKILASVPDGKFDYKPHAKSFALGQLASHIVDALGWANAIVELDLFEMDPAAYKPFDAKSTAELLAKFDENSAAAVAEIKGCADTAMFKTWTMKAGGKEVISMPRVAVLRGFVISHLIHHRAQLGVYLRMLDVPVPSVYGPTADFPDMF